MKIIPFLFHKSTPSFIGFELLKVDIFLQEKGTRVWETDEEDNSKSTETIVKEYLIENGLLGDVICVKDDCIYYKINPSLTNIKNFYNYLDSGLEEDSDIWRSFYFIPGESWNWSGFTDTLPLKNFGPITKFWSVLEKSILEKSVLQESKTLA